MASLTGAYIDVDATDFYPRLNLKFETSGRTDVVKESLYNVKKLIEEFEEKHNMTKHDLNYTQLNSLPPGVKAKSTIGIDYEKLANRLFKLHVSDDAAPELSFKNNKEQWIAWLTYAKDLISEVQEK